ncbi:Ureidoglycolate lyase [Serratia quinivorans]|uniref:fumarylacetoacetate hydrolase family protein n=1 Tax=Serratia quinivorans TaxID=137545 RepID=UPI002178A1C2|nr:fumarylacetoacetate hydrolase family protein [Serratia quinivorans]CAI1605801.1 Ureidoglycolate lyase [Serratia quinivorans]
MKFTTFLLDGEPTLGLVEGDNVIDINAVHPYVPADLRQALEANINLVEVGLALLESNAPRIPIAQLILTPAIPEPGKVICLGLNYFDHASESGRDKPEYPWFFYRGKSSLIAHNIAGRVPKVSERFDFEAELAVIIGKKVPRHTEKNDALYYVFGYSCFNDMSVRDYQKRTPQWTIGKNFDATGAFGPFVVTADEVPSGGAELRIQCRLNGEIMQDASTTDMIWSVAETISLLSECLTLEPGDVIAMGTPAGVGQARTPQIWMKSGDVVEVEIERIGLLRNQILAEEE